jgi:type IV pilus assembly protein PilB
VLIGEIRDKETATIAIEAALTGHLVLSSLHTNDAPSAISRLVEMDVETFLVASAIDAVVAQRLARILCEKCKQPYRPDEAELRAAGFPEHLLADIGDVFRAPDLRVAKNDCKACSGTGYRGRLGLYEVMLRSEEIERLTVERASADAIRSVAIEQGMQTLREDGLAKVRAGMTSIEEIARVVK